MLAFVLGEVIAVLKLEVIIFLLIISVMVIIKIITKKHTGVFVVIFLFIILGYSLTHYKMLQRDMVWSLEECSVTARGRAGKAVKTDYGYSLYLEKAVIDGEKCGKVIVFFEQQPDVRIGNHLEVYGKIKQFDSTCNEGNFDAKQYYISLGISTKIIADDYKITDSRYDNLRDFLYRLREKIIKNFSGICSWNEGNFFRDLYQNKAGIFSAILAGDKTELDEEIKELYSVSGIAHILAISGLHISMIGMVIYGIFRKRFSFGVSACFSIGMVTMFGIMSGMGIATIRAFVMFALRLIGEVLGRKYDYITAMSLAGLMLLLDNSFILINSGFQMSFGAIFAITIVFPYVCYICNLSGKTLKNIFFSLCISMVLNPMIAYNYFQLPTYSFLLNIVVVPLMSVVVVSAVVGSGAAFLSTFAGKAAITPGCLTIELYNRLCEMVSHFPFATIIVGRPSMLQIGLYYFSLTMSLAGLVLFRRKRNKKISAEEKNIDENGKVLVLSGIILKKQKKLNYQFRIVILALCIAVSGFIYIHPHSGLNIKFMDVGQGDGIFIRTDNGVTLTIDGGSTTISEVGKYRIASCIKADGAATIDYAIVTHADTDHISGLTEMLNMSGNNGIKIKHLVMPDISMKDEAYNELVNTAMDNQVTVLYISKGDVMKFGNTEIKCIHPGKGYISDDRNDYSTVLSLKYGRFSALFTGDIPSEQEIAVIEQLEGNYTVLKAAHHGSDYSSAAEFLEGVNPLYTVISSGENNIYGHPGQDTLNRLHQAGTKILRTDLCGEIQFFSDGKNMEIDVMKK